MFRLPARSASQRVVVWRALQKYGALLLKNSGYLLPNNPANRERLEWLATAIRKHKGEASVAQVQSINDMPFRELAQRFTQARNRDYQQLLSDLQQLLSAPHHQGSGTDLRRLRLRHQAVADVDFFRSPLRGRVEELLERASNAVARTPAAQTTILSAKDYVRKTWVTRPRPGIDRSASAWLIRRYIDRQARFVFAGDPKRFAGAIPFDMFHCEFGHSGEDCTFETLRKRFGIRDRGVAILAQIVHDADLEDEKFGRQEAFGIDQVLKGWARQTVPDKELLERGILLFDGLYRSLP